MKFTTLALIGITMLAGCSRRGDARLIGTWQSDADRTIAELKTSQKLTEPAEAGLRMVFGHKKRTFTPTTVTTDLNGAAGKNGTETESYTIVRKDAESITIKFRINNVDKEITIHFDGPDTYWQMNDNLESKEYFKRIN